jgi:hypothetical protein
LRGDSRPKEKHMHADNKGQEYQDKVDEMLGRKK